MKPVVVAIALLSLYSWDVNAQNELLGARTPVWTYSAPNPARVTVSDGGTAIVEYTVTNQSRRAKDLILKPTLGLSASSCHLAGKGSTCALTLTINGSLIPQQGIHAGPVLCEQGNPNQCYQPNPINVLHVSKNTVNTTSLQVSVSGLALSITGLPEYGILAGTTFNSGRARSITITNTGASAALNVMYTPSPDLPIGTTISPSSCGTIAPSGTCVLTIQPGSTPSAAAGETNPVPVTLTIAGTNTNKVSSALHILTYGSVYQGGYVFAFDDTKGCNSPTNCTGSVGGKVVTIEDQATDAIWSSNGASATTSDASHDIIPGVALTSTPSVGAPAFSALAGMFDYNNGGTTYTNVLSLTAADFERCNGKSDGACNTRNILKFYDTYVTNYDRFISPPFTAAIASTNRSYYAAGLCTQVMAGHDDWYLPAICEMGYDHGSGFPSGCGVPPALPILQNIQSNLVDASISGAPSGVYLSSTEDNALNEMDAMTQVWVQDFTANGGDQNYAPKAAIPRGVRCVRGF